MSGIICEEKSVSLYQSDNRVMNDAIDRLVVRLYKYKEQHKKSIILLTGCGSANGTTMVAINLAIAFADADRKTLLIDADMRKGAEYKRISGNAAGLSGYLEGRVDMDGIICSTNRSKLNFVQSGEPKKSAVRLLSSQRMHNFMNGMRGEYDFVVFDCPAITVAPDAAVLFPSVDCIALVLALGGVTKKQLAHAKQEAGKYSDKYAGLIVNRMDKRQYMNALPQYDYFAEYNKRKPHKHLFKGKM